MAIKRSYASKWLCIIEWRVTMNRIAKTVSLLLLLSICLADVQKWSSHSAHILPQKHWEMGLFQPFRYGYRHEVSLNTTNSGIWDILENGDAIWRLRIESTDAYHLSLMFNDFNLPEGAMLHIYDEVGGNFFGGYTSFNNSDYFTTPLLTGDNCIVEYFEPSNVEYNVNLEIVPIKIHPTAQL